MFKFDDIGQVCASFHCDSDIAPGSPCSVTRSNTVSLSREDEAFIGKVLSVRNNVANVAVKGFVTFPYQGSAPSIGFVPLCGDGAGGITYSTDSQTYLVVSVDVVNKTVTILL